MYPPPPSYVSLMNQKPKLEANKLNKIIEKYEIDYYFSEKLHLLEDFDIVLLCDDSGSMNTPLNDNTQYNTRWEELKSVVNIVISISTLFDKNGIDLYFLNRLTYKNIKNSEIISTAFDQLPQGRTPLTNTINRIFNEHKDNHNNVLVIIATDGVPDNLNHFKQALKDKHDKFFISFLACSDQECDIGYLNNIDKTIKNVDVLDDYYSELKEVKAIQGNKFKYTFGNHVVRLLCGPLCKELDMLDEKKKHSRHNCIIL